MSSSSCLHLLPRLSITSILPYLFPTLMCFRRQFLCKMWPIKLAFLRFIVHRLLLSSLFLCSSNSFFTWSTQLTFSVLLQHHVSKLPKYFSSTFPNKIVCKKVKWSRYRPGVAQRLGRGMALLFHDRGTRRGWVVSSTPRPHFTPGKDPVPIVKEAGWTPGPVWTGGISRPHRDSITDRPARSQSLYRLSYPA